MIDLSRIEGFDWDDGNGRKSLDRHGVDQGEAEQVFVDPRLVVLADEKNGVSENRFHALGVASTGRRLFISFTLRGTGAKIRVISARDMNGKEKVLHEQKA